MDKRSNAFESFIDGLLKTHERNDQLRNALKDAPGVTSAVEKILFESQISAFFIPHDDVTDEETAAIENKLTRLQCRIISRYPDKQAEDDHMVVEMIKRKSLEQNTLLSKEILLYLNSLYKEYGH